MRTLITGAKGQLGSSLLDIAPAHARVTGTDVCDLDLSNPDELKHGLGELQPEVIINSAAYTAVDQAETEAELAHRINATAVGTLADYCVETGCRLVHISTDYVFSGSSAEPYRPDDAAGPLNVYGKTKLAGELQAQKAGELARIVRSCWVYSEHGHNFVKTMLRLAADRDRLTVVNDQTGSPTYARNVATAIWGVVEQWPAERMLHYADAGTITWKQFAEAIFAEAYAIGLIPSIPLVEPISTEDYAAPASRPAFSALDSSLLASSLGFPAQSWQTALREMLQRYAETVLLPDRVELSGS